MPPLRRVLLAGLLLAALAAGGSAAEPSKGSGDGGDVPYVPTPAPVVDRMLELAGVGPEDYVIDLGSGDGRIVIAAAQRGALGHGVEIDPERNAEARAGARGAGVADRVVFVAQDFFESEVRPASVVTLYLFEEVNRKLRPKLLEELRPGTRIVSHAFGMGEWEPDETARVSTDQDGAPGEATPAPGTEAKEVSGEPPDEGSGPTLLGEPKILGDVDVTGPLDWPPSGEPSLVLDVHDVFLWVVPADARGRWRWEVDGRPFRLAVEQRFQELDVELADPSGDAPVEVDALELRGRRLRFLARVGERRYAYSGRIEGDAIEGTVHVRAEEGAEGTLRGWSASRSAGGGR